MGAGNEKVKSALCSEHHSEQILFSNAFQNVHHSQDRSGQKFLVFALEIPDDVVNDPNIHLVR